MTVGPVPKIAADKRRSDTLKPACPWCGSTSSTVYKSRGDLFEDVYRRTRTCADCQRHWPTVEKLDVERMRRALLALGLTLHDLGLTEGE